MARVTVEDCIDKIPNRFELVLLASHRARTIAAGAQIAVQRDNDKNPVVALREIAEKKVPTDTRMPVLGHDDQSADASIDKMTEEELLRRMASQSPSDGSNAGPRSR